MKCYSPFRLERKSEEYARKFKESKVITITAVMIPKPVPTRMGALSFVRKERKTCPHYLTTFCESTFYRQCSFQYFYVFIGDLVERTLD